LRPRRRGQPGRPRRAGGDPDVREAASQRTCAPSASETKRSGTRVVPLPTACAGTDRARSSPFTSARTSPSRSDTVVAPRSARIVFVPASNRDARAQPFEHAAQRDQHGAEPLDRPLIPERHRRPVDRHADRRRFFRRLGRGRPGGRRWLLRPGGGARRRGDEEAQRDRKRGRSSSPHFSTATTTRCPVSFSGRRKRSARRRSAGR
jgi:hypothetical protein